MSFAVHPETIIAPKNAWRKIIIGLVTESGALAMQVIVTASDSSFISEAKVEKPLCSVQDQTKIRQRQEWRGLTSTSLCLRIPAFPYLPLRRPPVMQRQPQHHCRWWFRPRRQTPWNLLDCRMKTNTINDYCVKTSRWQRWNLDHGFSYLVDSISSRLCWRSSSVMPSKYRIRLKKGKIHV